MDSARCAIVAGALVIVAVSVDGCCAAVGSVVVAVVVGWTAVALEVSCYVAVALGEMIVFDVVVSVAAVCSCRNYIQRVSGDYSQKEDQQGDP